MVVQKYVRLNAQRGIALVEILIAVGIAGIVLAATTTMMEAQRQETKALSEKLAALDFQRTLSGVLAVPTACGSIVNSANLTSGSTLQFNPSSVTSTNAAAPTVIAGLNKIFSTDGVSVLADSSTGTSVSALASSLKLKTLTGVQVGAYRSGANINYALMINFDEASMVRPIRSLVLPLLVTTSPAGSDLRIDTCQGAAVSSADEGAICGNRTVFCKGPGSAVYDGITTGGVQSWKSDNVPCQGTTLTATCSSPPDPYGYGNVQVTSVSGCPAGYVGGQTQVGCTKNGDWTIEGPTTIACGGTGNLAIAYIYCRKN